MKHDAPDSRFFTLLEFNLSHQTGKPVKITDVTPVYGGDINSSYRLRTTAGDFFVKLNDAQLYPGMFRKEARGLNEIRSTGSIYAPQVILTGETDDVAYLVLEYIPHDAPRDRAFWREFGEKLAAMHRHTHTYYGFDEDNYIGTLIQINTPSASWPDFYIENRLKPQVKMAVNKGLYGPAEVALFERLYDLMPHIVPEELPHLLHGDLWGGNFLASPAHGPVLIDPAVYYGHREVDLAMTLLFGGFEDAFYDAYHAAFPLEEGWRDRIPLYQLYPLLVHANLFGGSYVPSVIRTLRRLLARFGG
ncbi:MAG: fructosamine kinase family protein [Chlorobi bacterium]|nr:fructosamine kinase family protein [Chlorobiota bacterium]